MTPQETPTHLSVDLDQLWHALEHDELFFINFFLFETLKEGEKVPEFHVDVFRSMCTSAFAYYCCAIPRGHAKTTLAKLAAVRFWLFTDIRFIVYLSNTTPVAAAAVNDIIGFLFTENFRTYHLQICGQDIQFHTEQEAHGYYKFTLFPGTEREKLCIIKALGAGKQVRGMNIDNERPQLAIIDDAEDIENISTKSAYEKFKSWLYGTFLKALAKKHKVIQLGNMISYYCTIKDHTESKFWDAVRYGCLLENGEPLWPEVWPLEEIKVDFERYKEQGMLGNWYAEMMNMPIAEGRGLLEQNDITYKPAMFAEDIEFGFITVDPAISTKSWGHRTGIAVYGYVEPSWQVVETYADFGVDPLKLFDKIIELCYRWKINTVGIEAVAYQKSIKYVFDHLCLTRHIYGMNFVDLFAAAHKTERFAAWAAEVKLGNIVLTDNDVLLTQQALLYDPAKKDNDCDLLDAAAYAPQMLQRYMYLIMQSYKGGKIPEVTQSIYEISAV